MPEDTPKRSRRWTNVVLWLAAAGSLAFAFWQMCAYMDSRGADPVRRLPDGILVAPAEDDQFKAIKLALLLVPDAPPIAPPETATPTGAWMLNQVKKGRVDLHWGFDVKAERSAIEAYFQSALTRLGYCLAKKSEGKFFGPMEVWRKNENIIIISLRNEPENARIRLIIRQIRPVEPADYKRTFSKR
ncbi:MAG: hypothetical protein HN370_06030 [Phycisphaerales bacterium]|nr:hypothetical protein [Phycisphaerales bacterium]